jgi:pilus assembly protein CpaE
MPNKDGKSSVLAISTNTLILESVNAAFVGEPDFEVLDNTSISTGINETIAKLQAEVVLVDFEYKEEGTYELIDKIATDFPMTSVIAILPEEKVQYSDKVILSGARAFILYPFTTKNLLSTTRRVVELMKRNFPALSQQDMGVGMPTKPKNTYTIFSPKGGSGVSLVAVNLAIALRQLMKTPFCWSMGNIFLDMSP